MKDPFSEILLKRLLAVAMLSATLLAGCTFNAPDGPPFRAHPGPSDQEALVYVYRPPTEKWGHDRTYYLFDEKEKLTDLLHGSYCPVLVEPGKTMFLADVNRDFRTWIAGGAVELAAAPDGAVVEFDADPGKTYFVRFHPIAHAFTFEPTMTLVSESEGLYELRRCKLLSGVNPE